MTAGSVIESTEKSRENTLVHTVTNYSAADEIMPMGSVIDSTEKALKTTKIHTLYQLNAIDEIIPAGSIIDSITHPDILKFNGGKSSYLQVVSFYILKEICTCDDFVGYGAVHNICFDGMKHIQKSCQKSQCHVYVCMYLKGRYVSIYMPFYHCM